MKKRLSAFVCFMLALLWCACAMADSYVSFLMPEGAEHKLGAEAREFAVPKGLEPMYQLMLSDGSQNHIDLFRMKNGRALLSISISRRQDIMTTQQLLPLWQRFAETIARETQYVDNSESCVKLGSRFGRETLEIDTTAVAGDDASLKLTLHCSAFCRENDLVEVWVVYPAQTAYLFDDEALAQRNSDVADVEDLLASLNFGIEGDTAVVSDEPEIDYAVTDYADPQGRFETKVPEGSLILTSGSDEAAFAKLRSDLIAKHGEGAGVLCDNNYADITNEGATMIVLPDLNAVAMVYRVNAPGFAGATNDDLLLTYKATEESLMKKFGEASCILSNGHKTISAQEHAWMTYWLSSQGTEMILNLMCCVDEEGWLREIDVFWLLNADDVAEKEKMLNSIVNTMQYKLPTAQ